MKIQIKSIYGNVLFEYEKENNTVKETLIEANNREVDVSFAYLRGAYLRGADLREVNLRGADLRFAYLGGADLSGADLSGAYLSGAYLPIYCKWNVVFKTNGLIKIGCKEKTIGEWDAWFVGDDVFETKRDTPEFKRIYAHYRAVREYYLLTKDL